MADKQWTKLNALVDKDFTVEKVWGYKWKAYINGEFRESDKWEKGYSKKWEVDTETNKVELSQSQIGSMLESVMKNGESNIIGKTFHVKSNGKSGIDIRYFINPVYDKQPDQWESDTEEDKVNVDDIPF